MPPAEYDPAMPEADLGFEPPANLRGGHGGVAE
jgi:hypothetical protein